MDFYGPSWTFDLAKHGFESR